jgi:hypothetical protein
MSRAMNYIDALKPMNTPKFIPPGKYTAIDDIYYRGVKPVIALNESYGSMGKPLQPKTSIHWCATPFVSRQAGLLNSVINVNYGQYLFNSQSGWQ